MRVILLLVLRILLCANLVSLRLTNLENPVCNIITCELSTTKFGKYINYFFFYRTLLKKEFTFLDQEKITKNIDIKGNISPRKLFHTQIIIL